ncbi:phosphoribosylformylglycinamidine synthase [Clostridiales bacterium COT073_COT-073]|nr:phosphoribosylformylglycinamidine synthase [Clostridiales bacterium COT073_COT-073]
MVKRFLVQKLETFAEEKHSILEELKGMFSFAEDKLTAVELWNCYDVEADLSDQEWQLVLKKVLSEVNTDAVGSQELKRRPDTQYFAFEYLPGQFDQRADSAMQCILAVTGKKAKVQSKKIVGLTGDLSEAELERIKKYLINDVDSHEISLEIPENLEIELKSPEKIALYHGFLEFTPEQVKTFYEQIGFAMSYQDLLHCQKYFRSENRNPSVTELKVIDTYWSDHCRHTTFATVLKEIEWENDSYLAAKQEAYHLYQESKAKYSAGKPQTLMDMATIGMKEMKARGLLENLDQSAEINACSIRIPVSYVEADGNEKNEIYLLQFKNETHNHPTEIEPFGGAATCLGGAIRDPLSGRAYVFGGMRVTGAADPNERIEDTLAGKLPQRKITVGAADGYSSYGNQIGLATGEVREYYHPGFKAKRMELGAVIAAVPEKQVRRAEPAAGDIVVVLGGATGRDGVGGATGSSKAHSTESIDTAGAEVQKGNAPEERKLQRLFRNPEFSLCIKRCNDFGAGGVSVAIGELADGLDIDLDSLPKKYEGLDGTELAVSESQERMAIVIEPEDWPKVEKLAAAENITAVKTATINDQARLRMYWRGDKILDLDRNFLNTNGVLGETKVVVPAISAEHELFTGRVAGQLKKYQNAKLKEDYLQAFSALNVACQLSLAEKFDSTVGRGTVLFPYGGKTQTSKVDGMVFKIPTEKGMTNQVAYMTHGYCPDLASWSPFHGALFSGVMAAAKAVCLGADYKELRLSCQEYFERLRNQPKRWGKPVAALLGSYYFQTQMGLASIGGKDSMSGSFEDLDVPPTLVTFAVSAGRIDQVISPELKGQDTVLAYYPLVMDEQCVPDFNKLKEMYEHIYSWNLKKQIVSAKMVEHSIAIALAGMAFGNELGVELAADVPELFAPDYGSILLEIPAQIWEQESAVFTAANLCLLGRVTDRPEISWQNQTISIGELKSAWKKPLAGIFKDHGTGRVMTGQEEIKAKHIERKSPVILRGVKPLVCIPVFPGTNCEYDVAKAFVEAGAMVENVVIRNRSRQELEQSIGELKNKIEKAHILALAGGFSAGDEPDGAGKFIAAILSEPVLKEGINQHVKQKKGLILGICNGFQALVKTGLLPYGEIRDLEEDSPTLTYNKIGRHISRMVTTRICSLNTPWASRVELGELHQIAVSHGEGRFYANAEWIQHLIDNQQIFTRYVDVAAASYTEGENNPNGSAYAIEGIISRDGLILGKMGHTERYENGLLQNIPGSKNQNIFKAGVEYFM